MYYMQDFAVVLRGSCCCCCCRHSYGDISSELWCSWSGYFLLQWQNTSDGRHLHQSSQLQGNMSLIVLL